MREHWARLLATLIGQLRDFELAEDALQDAVEQALTHWPTRGIPDHPEAWLLTTARRRALNQLKRRANFERKRSELAVLAALETDDEAAVDEPLPDDRLRLIFTCCHPALALPAQVALTLRTIGGLSTAQIARAFVVSESTMAQRLVRAKRKIGAAAIPYRVPPPTLWAERLDAVLYVVYFVFNEGYAGAEQLIRAELVDEAIRLARLLSVLAPDEPEVDGLLALMLFHDSRRAARLDGQGRLMTLEQQDRRLWDRDKIRQADGLLRRALIRGPPGPYRLQAAISGVHARAGRFADTDWSEIVALYRLLGEIEPSPVVRLNEAVARSFADGVTEALEVIDGLAGDRSLDAYQPFHAARADLLRRVGRTSEAIAAYRRALALTDNPTERRFLEARLAQID